MNSKYSFSELRNADRNKEGGDYLSPIILTSNFGNLENLNQYYILFKTVHVINTSEAEHKVLCIDVNKELTLQFFLNHSQYGFKLSYRIYLRKISKKKQYNLARWQSF